MKVAERQILGYSEDSLNDSRQGYLYHSWSRGKQVPVRGLCFAAGNDSPRLARDFAVEYLNLGVISFRMAKLNLEDWQRIMAALLDNQVEMANVAFLLHDLDFAATALADVVADVIDVSDDLLWLATVHDPEGLPVKLRLPFLVYLGFGKTGRMRYLAQDEQSMLIDRGSLKRPDGG